MTGDDFRAWRARLELSQEQAARALGVTKRMVRFYEKGEKPDEAAPDGVREIGIPRAIALACAALEAGLEAI